VYILNKIKKEGVYGLLFFVQLIMMGVCIVARFARPGREAASYYWCNWYWLL